jgi:hypothetical protein
MKTFDLLNSETLKQLIDLFNQDDLISCTGIKTELGYEREVFHTAHITDVEVWLNSMETKKIKLNFLHGNLWGDSDLKKTEVKL